MRSIGSWWWSEQVQSSRFECAVTVELRVRLRDLLVSFSSRAGGPAAGHLACALRPDERFRQREGASARTRGLRPASPVGPGTETLVTERARSRRRCSAAALSEGTHPTRDRAGKASVPERPERRPGACITAGPPRAAKGNDGDSGRPWP